MMDYRPPVSEIVSVHYPVKETVARDMNFRSQSAIIVPVADAERNLPTLEINFRYPRRWYSAL